MLPVLCIFFIYYRDVFEDPSYKQKNLTIMLMNFLKADILIISLEAEVQITVLFLSR